MFSIAARYFIKAKGKSATILSLSVFGASVNIAFFILCFAFARGCSQTLISRVLDMHWHAKVFDLNAQYKSDLVDRAFKIVTFNGKLTDCNQGLMIKCVKRNELRPLLKNYIKEDGLGTKKKKIILIGSILAKMYRIKIGETISLSFIADDLIKEDFYVAGITHFGIDDYDRYMIHMAIEGMPKIKGETYRSVYLKDPLDVYKYNEEMSKLGTITSIWPKMFSTLLDISGMVQVLVFMLLGIFILTSAIQSVSGLVALMLDKANDMRIFSILGMTNFQKFKILSSYGLFISAANVGLGSGIGALLVYLLNLILRTIKFDFKTDDFIGILTLQHFLLIIAFALIINVTSMLVGTIYVISKGDD